MNALYVEPVLPLSYLLQTNSRQLRILNSNYRTEMQKNILISTNWFTKLTAFCNSAIEQDNPHCWPTYQHFYFLSTETSYIFGQYSHYHTPYNAQMFPNGFVSSGCQQADKIDINHMLIMLIRADGCRQTELIKRTTHVMSLPWMQQTIDSSAWHLVKTKIDTKRKM